MVDDVKSLRAARVADTEERILAAARGLFLRDGYAATTLAAVADAARVGHRTVYVRFGTKAALLKRVVDVAVAGDTRPIDVVSRDWFQAALAAPTLAERVTAYASASADLMARAGDLIAIAQQAEPVEPAIATAARGGREGTRDAVRLFCTRLRDDGLIPEGSDLTWLAGTAGLLSQAQTYLLGRDTLGWTSDQYQQWLATTLRRLIAAAGAGG
jgi:AcrR family transcriptional regulator